MTSRGFCSGQWWLPRRLAVYGGAYWALLDPDPQWDKTETVLPLGTRWMAGSTSRHRPQAPGSFRITVWLGNVGEAIFSPAHWVDGKIRQTKWAVRVRPTNPFPESAASLTYVVNLPRRKCDRDIVPQSVRKLGFTR